MPFPVCWFIVVEYMVAITMRLLGQHYQISGMVLFIILFKMFKKLNTHFILMWNTWLEAENFKHMVWM